MEDGDRYRSLQAGVTVKEVCAATQVFNSGHAMIETLMESGEITASAYLVVASAGSWCDIHAFVPGLQF